MSETRLSVALLAFFRLRLWFSGAERQLRDRRKTYLCALYLQGPELKSDGICSSALVQGFIFIGMMIYNCKSRQNQAGLFDRTHRAYHPTVKKPTVDPVHAAGRRLCCFGCQNTLTA